VQNALEDAYFLLQDNKHKLSETQIILFAEMLDMYYQQLDSDQLTIHE